MKSEEEAVLRLGFGPYDANGARDLVINRSKFVFWFRSQFVLSLTNDNDYPQ